MTKELSSRRAASLRPCSSASARRPGDLARSRRCRVAARSDGRWTAWRKRAAPVMSRRSTAWRRSASGSVPQRSISNSSSRRLAASAASASIRPCSKARPRTSEPSAVVAAWTPTSSQSASSSIAVRRRARATSGWATGRIEVVTLSLIAVGRAQPVEHRLPGVMLAPHQIERVRRRDSTRDRCRRRRRPRRSPPGAAPACDRSPCWPGGSAASLGADRLALLAPFPRDRLGQGRGRERSAAASPACAPGARRAGPMALPAGRDLDLLVEPLHPAVPATRSRSWSKPSQDRLRPGRLEQRRGMVAPGDADRPHAGGARHLHVEAGIAHHQRRPRARSRSRASPPRACSDAACSG